MSESKISVVIPVYNVDKYLSQCVDSVINQTYKNLEIILVDDGSKDDSPQLCDNYAQQDNRITVIHKSNGGLSSARNAGIRAARGDYITFLDSDDFWDDGSAVQKLIMQTLESKADVVSWGFKKFYEQTAHTELLSLNIDRSLLINKESSVAFYNMIKYNCFLPSACNKLIRKELFDKYNLLFVEGVYSEDIEWCVRLAIHSDSFDVFPGNFYVYRQRIGSISKSLTEKNIFDLESSIDLCIELLDTSEFSAYKEALYGYTATQYANYLICLQNFQGELSKRHYEYAKEHRYLLKYGFSTRVKMIRVCCNLVGMKFTIDLLGLTKTLKTRVKK